ncbi:hypothetical protein PSEUDO8Z_180002 [Pseudomonas sp. 8Z]|uniref:hypothetical protein n=1 Tax=Pseudomonas sp. 8Z TaxID=2653166 RepID=UPI0012F223BB|nr:hypothetical protein [Pseudomonas sp. 8Z]VXC84138.1 hypothetical protein PSEUDO8Z_180002 [Pseudomonas sp. 8Z]
MSRLPVIGVSACFKALGRFPSAAIRAVARYAGWAEKTLKVGCQVSVAFFFRDGLFAPLISSFALVVRLRSAACMRLLYGMPVIRAQLFGLRCVPFVRVCAQVGGLCLSAVLLCQLRAAEAYSLGRQVAFTHHPVFLQAFGEACRGRMGQR